MAFTLFVILLILQRLIELFIAKRNENWMKRNGAYEAGRSHYKYIVLVHIFFLLSFILEVVLLNRTPAVWWWMPFLFFVLAQCMRIWSIASLGPYWNTRIIIMPGADVIEKGPYRLMRHPNYVVVTVEILMIPLIFQAYFTSVLFTFLNAIVLLKIRIPAEEKALFDSTNYAEAFQQKKRFTPSGKKDSRI
jgi:methyltransferase